ncbi:primosomal protein N' [candidate division KSB1 bacterium]
MTVDETYVGVAVSLPAKGLFTYRVPKDFEQKVKTGLLVLVPFKKRLVSGCIFNIFMRKPSFAVKDVADIIDDKPVLTIELIELAQWISEYYLCPLGEVIRIMLPKGIEQKSIKTVYLKKEGLQGTLSGFDLYSGTEKRILANISSKKLVMVSTLIKVFDEVSVNKALLHFQKDGIAEVAHTLMEPRVKPKYEDYVKLNDKNTEAGEKIPSRAKVQKALYEHLKASDKIIPKGMLIKNIGSAPSLKSLINKGIVEIISKEVKREYPVTAGEEYRKPKKLTDEQKNIISEVKKDIDNNIFRVFLMHGVTGSGKTQVYIELISEILDNGKGVVLLVPEIMLTSQAVNRLNSYFQGKVSFLHSHMSAGEKYDAWREIRSGEKRLVVGPRSAVFAPINNLGLIIVDEEHDSSYKQNESAPRYNAKDSAVIRAKINNCPIMLGSATPSLESYHNTETGKYKLVELPNRIDNIPMPKVKIVSLLKEPKGQKIFSGYLTDKVVKYLQKGEQVILLQNRRGFSTFIQCRDCGFIDRCRNCNITLTYHRTGYKLVCHYCSYIKDAPVQCPNCLGKNLYYSGTGTQRVSEEIKRLFPDHSIVRMDRDTTTEKGSHSRITAEFELGMHKILLGTQMVSKGLDFSNVNLVGVISADTGLLLPDFRASERTFQLLTQAAGRAGRRKKRGEVVIQTYFEENYSIKYAVKQDFKEFYAIESEIRSQLMYPPYGKLILIGFKGENENDVSRTSGRFVKILKSQKRQFQIFGPSPSALTKIKKKFRWQIIVKGKREQAKAMREAVGESYDRFNKLKKIKGVNVTIDVDPLHML